MTSDLGSVADFVSVWTYLEPTSMCLKCASNESIALVLHSVTRDGQTFGCKTVTKLMEHCVIEGHFLCFEVHAILFQARLLQSVVRLSPPLQKAFKRHCSALMAVGSLSQKRRDLNCGCALFWLSPTFWKS